MGTHPIFESDFDCLTDNMDGGVKAKKLSLAHLQQLNDQVKLLESEFKLNQKKDRFNPYDAKDFDYRQRQKKLNERDPRDPRNKRRQANEEENERKKSPTMEEDFGDTYRSFGQQQQQASNNSFIATEKHYQGSKNKEN